MQSGSSSPTTRTKRGNSRRRQLEVAAPPSSRQHRNRNKRRHRDRNDSSIPLNSPGQSDQSSPTTSRREGRAHRPQRSHEEVGQDDHDVLIEFNEIHNISRGQVPPIAQIPSNLPAATGEESTHGTNPVSEGMSDRHLVAKKSVDEAADELAEFEANLSHLPSIFFIDPVSEQPRLDSPASDR